MAGKILRRCTICNNFHASYLVQDEKLGKCYLCYTCWKARTASALPDEKKVEKTETKGGPAK